MRRVMIERERNVSLLLLNVEKNRILTPVRSRKKVRVEAAGAAKGDITL